MLGLVIFIYFGRKHLFEKLSHGKNSWNRFLRLNGHLLPSISGRGWFLWPWLHAHKEVGCVCVRRLCEVLVFTRPCSTKSKNERFWFGLFSL